ncbi:unnamed protein product [Nezara viridula]|uniref:Alkylglycerol monooxygenase n=1 Tax=Nezara viridula TaxID=85310 RepID=A0A9P0HGD0_NEZVI|nr:unnamed protein product [Nezara viridula]
MDYQECMDARNSSYINCLNNDEDIAWLHGLGNMFYLLSRNETTFKNVEDVPPFFRQAWPYFLLFIFLENVLLWLEKKPLMRINDGIVSLSHGLFQELGRLLFRGGESILYIWIYNNYRIADLQWDSPITWYLTAIGVDFCYYWVHRAKVHILWAQHQVHHSSEDYNLAVGLRQSVLQSWCGFIFYLPMALFVPPSLFLTHQQFNLLYQFWIHTEAVQSLGPLELVLNTPKHHRVHHGSVMWCLDKNYGGVLIIWDRLFGTFAEDRAKEKIIYGLVIHEPSFNPLYLQVFYNKNVWNKFRNMEGWQNKLSSIIKGPSWLPGRPWAGCDADKIDVKEREKFDVQLPLWCNCYLVLHFIAVVVSYHDLAKKYMEMTPLTALIFVLYIIGSLTLIGMMFENKRNVFLLESLRCAILALILHRNALTVSLPFLKWFFVSSVFFWALHFARVIRIRCLKVKKL